MSARAVAAALAAAVMGLTGCSGEADSEEPRTPALEGCGPVSYDDVAGRAPSYVDGPLDPVPNDHALCAGAWLPPTSETFVPQGLVVRGRTAWVSGYDRGRTRVGSDTCRVVRLDLRTGKELAQRAPIRAGLAPRGPASCRHAGGLSLDDHGLWISQFTKVWLLDPDTFDVRRVWHLVDEVRGSFLVHDDRGRLGVGGFHGERRWPLHWFEPGVLFESGRLDLTPDDAAAVQLGPSAGQGALWADLGPGPAQVWFTRSNTYCGELWAGPRRRFAFHPGAEGVAYARGRVWVVSETTAAPYFLDGGRPVVPTLAHYDVRDLPRWERSDCGT
ncbi:hypothetical protein [Nocardioides bizhenqiangii]|uniref:Lipoprotein n=1 Tax=Nocardioides bizhenqiangii TaxID=3095076 RepID=A0ABZ0ZTB7_9ACTN|nr:MULTISPECIES: hypothetical protein [unclassified Nocardioides]MDZ5622784.1 hypothetical protein [Nocardioides sp. HM23]WQQ27046.1 hypothetical protein SHK19_02180 [Nocardioides sp. HM61]